MLTGVDGATEDGEDAAAIPDCHKSSGRHYESSGGHLDFHNALDVKVCSHLLHFQFIVWDTYQKDPLGSFFQNPNLSCSDRHVGSGIESGAAMEREGIPTGAPINATDRWSMQDRLTTSRNKNDIGQYQLPPTFTLTQ